MLNPKTKIVIIIIIKLKALKFFEGCPTSNVPPPLYICIHICV